MPDKKRGPLTDLGAETQATGKIFEDLPAHEQTQPRSVCLGGEERLKQPAAIRDRDAATVVLDNQGQIAVSTRAVTWIRPSSSVASIAFKTRLSTTCVR